MAELGNSRCWARRRRQPSDERSVVTKEASTETAMGQEQADYQKRPKWAEPEQVAERKRRSLDNLHKEGGRLLRDVRLDREANDALAVLQARHGELDNGAIVRLALVEQARRCKKR